MIIVLDALPLTLNGKVDRQALLAAERVASAPTASCSGLEKNLEQDLARIWATVLGVAQVDRRRNLSDLGGTSLQMMQLQAVIQRELDRHVAITDLFVYPTVAALADHMAGLQVLRPNVAPLSEVRERAGRQSEALRRLSRMRISIQPQSLRKSGHE